MQYRIDFEKIRTNYEFKDNNEKVRLRHKHGKGIKILPYVAHKASKEVITEFKEVLGELCRIIYNKKLKDDKCISTIIDKVSDKVTFKSVEEESKFKDILNKVFLDLNNDIQIFHPVLFNYISLGKVKKTNKEELAKYLYSIFFRDNEIEHMISNKFEEIPQNILLKLMYESLEELESREEKYMGNEYKLQGNYVLGLFKKDLKFIISDSKLFTENFERLLKYYYFFYVSQLALKLDKFFNCEEYEVERIFFNLAWEKTSKKRSSYSNGWEYLKTRIEHLFSHVICLDLLNHRLGELNEKYTYLDIKNIVYQMDEEEKNKFSDDVNKINNIYRQHLGDVYWDKLIIELNNENEVINSIYALFKTIDFQFNQPESGRKGIDRKYSSWFELFCNQDFLKSRGPLGNTLNITEEYLIFITKLCIKNEEKIRLTILFDEYEKRGLFFDKDSKQKIVQLFEKLNLLEKKSDSGDAQYVRSI